MLLGLEPIPWEASSQKANTQELNCDSVAEGTKLEGQTEIETIFQWILVPSRMPVGSTVSIVPFEFPFGKGDANITESSVVHY